MTKTSPDSKELLLLENLREKRARVVARRELISFTQYTMPAYRVGWFNIALANALQRFFFDVAAGLQPRLMVYAPPQHGKSQLTSRHFPAWCFGQNPDIKIIACSHTASWASALNRDVQRIIDSPLYRNVFPATTLNSDNVVTIAGRPLRNSEAFEIVGHTGLYKCAGVGGTITGRPMEIGIIDDPVLNAADAISEVTRESTWEWYLRDFYTRLAPKSGVLLVMTRWHEDDLAGRLLALMAQGGDRWEVLRFPALAENDETNRKQGDALFPERYSREMLENVRAQDPYTFEAMYQQNPTGKEGAMFKVAVWGEPDMILDAAPPNLRYCRAWDLAATADGGDYTVGALLACDSARRFYVVDIKRGQWSTDRVKQEIMLAAQTDPKGTMIHLPEDPGQAGVDQSRFMVRMLAGYQVLSEKVTKAKIVRAREFSSQVNAGNVRLIRGLWNRDFIEELRQFDRGKHDDQVDAASDSFNQLALGGPAIKPIIIQRDNSAFVAPAYSGGFSRGYY